MLRSIYLSFLNSQFEDEETSRVDFLSEKDGDIQLHKVSPSLEGGASSLNIIFLKKGIKDSFLIEKERATLFSNRSGEGGEIIFSKDQIPYLLKELCDIIS
ncbi:MAG: hypothetical protein GF387_00530, partial [Candidatus Portnoybacteria bacterium]|nr:hypothetical protein [Candidatus Portnoybacteria bacterium]